MNGIGCYDYDIVYRPGKNNIPVDVLTCAHGGATIGDWKLQELHVRICHTGATRLAHFPQNKKFAELH